MTIPDEFTRLLVLAQNGDASAENELFGMIDNDLRMIATAITRGNHHARATSLVNQAYIYTFHRIKVANNLDLKNRRYFFTAIADRMRKILLDRMKKRCPGEWDPALDEFLLDFRESTSWDYELLHTVLEEFLQSDNPRKRRRHQLINLHFFGGLTYKAAARELGISDSQSRVDRAQALAELQQAISLRTP